MTNPNYTHILAIVDRSGSMNVIKGDMENGLNAYFSQQAEVEGKCLVDYVQFDNVYEVVYKGRDISKATAKIEPRGMTALLDAIGRGVTELGAKLRKMRVAERPGRVQVVVVTDGLENVSNQWTKEKVKELIQQQENQYNWDFVFLGTGFDAVNAGVDYGFQRDKSLTFNAKNIGQMADTLSNYTTSYRIAGASAASFSDEDRDANS